MNKVLCILLITFFIAVSAFSQNKIIVKFKSNTDYRIDYATSKIICSNAAFAAIINRGMVQKITSLVKPGAKSFASLKRTDLINNIHFFTVDSFVNIDALVTQLAQTGLFEYVEKNQMASCSGVAGITPNDAYFSRQWGLVNDGTFSATAVANADVDMDEAWTISTGSSSTIVCVLDTGLKLDHPEVAGKLWVNSGEIAGNGIDDDSDGYIDDVNGWDWINGDNNPADDHGHGTNCSGILGASGNNNIGYAGADWNCKLMTGKVLGSNGNGDYTSMMNGIYYAVAHGANIISMSIGGSSFSQGLKDACDFAHANNVALFACMMNFNNSVPYYPAAFASTIAIGATDVNDYRVEPFFWSATSGSNYGSHIDLVAPGNYVYGLSNTSNTNYNSYWGGTSQATPLVAGVASLMHGLKPDLTVEQIRTILRSTAKDLVGRPIEDTPGWDQYMGAGRMNAHNALQAVLNLMPVKMSGLKGVMKNETAMLSWKTFEELNAKYFEVERSQTAMEWQKIGKENAKGNATSETSYSFTDNSPLEGVDYYRLKQIDSDGHFQYSNVVKLLKGKQDITVKAASPFTSSMRLMVSTVEAHQLGIHIFSVNGALIKEVKMTVAAGMNDLQIDAADFAKGTYSVIVSNGTEKIAGLTVIKQ